MISVIYPFIHSDCLLSYYFYALKNTRTGPFRLSRLSPSLLQLSCFIPSSSFSPLLPPSPFFSPLPSLLICQAPSSLSTFLPAFPQLIFQFLGPLHLGRSRRSPASSHLLHHLRTVVLVNPSCRAIAEIDAPSSRIPTMRPLNDILAAIFSMGVQVNPSNQGEVVGRHGRTRGG